jgi:hypothetical protein
MLFFAMWGVKQKEVPRMNPPRSDALEALQLECALQSSNTGVDQPEYQEEDGEEALQKEVAYIMEAINFRLH